ncbi:Pkinase-domain-containing protein [Xylariaceae sp. FL0804]|nr:Pkinase-domain-containing protein [Xylariaceae sp. FL0804]
MMSPDSPRQQERPQGASVGAPEHPDGNLKPPERAPAVRFSSTVENIEPPSVAPQEGTEAPESPAASRDGPPTDQVIRELTNTLQGVSLQEQRIKNYSYEAFSLPASRAPSNENSPVATPQLSHSPMAPQSPRFASGTSDPTSPPLTPAGTTAAEATAKVEKSEKPSSADGSFNSQAITPQASGQDLPSTFSRIGLPHRPASHDNITHRLQIQTADNDERGIRGHRKGMASLGPTGQSLPGTREPSPSRYSASQFYTRPFTPQGDVNDPYAASRRPVQSRQPGPVDQRFVFSRKKKHPSPSSSSNNLSKQEKRQSGLFGTKNKSGDLHPTGSVSTTYSSHGSMSNLKRFFKGDGGHKSKKASSPAPSKSASASKATLQVPFADDHGLSSKYGKIGRVLGAGAGGSVKLMKRSEDNTIFAVKEFRPRHSYETEKEYVKKLTAEFCVGSALHHGNIIETLDIVQEKGKWYEVMEYAPYDLFAIVMTGKMSKSEITCCFLQILSGVTYLHAYGLAHRDLKLDNVVVSQQGIMKIIDFGSAHVFKYPFESETVLAGGIVGSDPYLAPEVYNERKYDPQAVDIWSLAIIFCCMSLRRFPWKVPRVTDNSFKLFASEPTPGHDPKRLVLPSGSTDEPHTASQTDVSSQGNAPQAQVRSNTEATTSPTEAAPQQREVIKGPWRLLRLLPRESRHIIGRMLTINPEQRAQMAEILEEPWVSDTEICRQTGPGVVVNVEDHKHVLEPPAPPK